MMITRSRVFVLFVFRVFLLNNVTGIKVFDDSLKVVHGDEVVPHSLPYVVALKTVIDEKEVQCGGSLIQANKVLTAAYCVYGAETVEVILGAHNLTIVEDTQVHLESSNFTVHEEYDTENHLNDIAVVYLSEDVTLTAEIQSINAENGGDLINAVTDMIKGFPQNEIKICYTTHNKDFLEHLVKQFDTKRISVMLFNLSTIETQEKYYDTIKYNMENNKISYTVFFGSHKFYEHLLIEINNRNFIRRNLVYIFNWGRQALTGAFLQNIHHAMRVFIITNPRNDAFRLYFNQATSHRKHHLGMVNWWNQKGGLFTHPTLPNKKSVYKDFHGKVLKVPVLHKPPWHFVKYYETNHTFKVLGGRDDRILSLLSKKLNFKYHYFDPPQRIQGSPISENGTFNGVMGLMLQREADLFIGDVGITYERSHAVEFSFITLADSGAFVTHAPSRLNEALALLRPFQWQVWPAIGVTFIIVGPFLYALIALPNLWQPRFRVRSHARLFFDCTWFTVTILLKQTGREPSSTIKARFFISLLSISATYVITDMYSANLTSLLARPGREKAINNLYQLRDVMSTADYHLYVERHSPSFSLLENGTGIYGEIWNIMERKQEKYVVESVEEGVKLVKDRKDVAVMAGRETLFFDIQRFGSDNFHLSKKLNTAYSAVALQLGCPYIEEINKILMAIFEAGIITKMTENEYEKLGRQKKVAAPVTEGTTTVQAGKKETKRIVKASENNEKLKPISLKMLQGSFYLLLIGHLFSGLVLIAEILFKKQYGKLKRKKKKNVMLQKCIKRIRFNLRNFKMRIIRAFNNFMHDAFTQTLEYIE
ncbi:ionotropic receptor 40a-like [Sitophilus oryzae]|uniref:Ionotropic receptor 40a-like n=1 Tax=Sitophilus oryzae TaxID=7048 RepID=A0A6J2YJA0_SITOR|nr:ionotropic receptor 40a-like [Sitophilus oryzae]